MPSDGLDIDVAVTLGDFRLEVAHALPFEGITAVFGPSASGKSTLLRTLAGFEAARGRIVVAGTTWLDSARGLRLPVFRRPVGFLFQDARLFSHLDVAGNLRYAARRAGGGSSSGRARGWSSLGWPSPGRASPRRFSLGRAAQGTGASPASSPAITLDDVVAAFDLEALLPRRVEALSGGERQRVALARTLLTRPELLLLDEPLAAIDLDRKAEILPYLESLSARFGIPTLYVSHAIDEVARLSDHTLVLTDGRVRAFGPTPAILERLDVQSIAGPLEASVVLEARVTGHDPRYRLTRLDLGGQAVSMPEAVDLDAGATARLRVRARDVAIATSRPSALSIRNVLEGTVAELTATTDSPFAEVLVDVRGQHLRARITRAAADDLGLHVGQRVHALVKSVSLDG